MTTRNHKGFRCWRAIPRSLLYLKLTTIAQLWSGSSTGLTYKVQSMYAPAPAGGCSCKSAAGPGKAWGRLLWWGTVWVGLQSTDPTLTHPSSAAARGSALSHWATPLPWGRSPQALPDNCQGLHGTLSLSLSTIPGQEAGWGTWRPHRCVGSWVN